MKTKSSTSLSSLYSSSSPPSTKSLYGTCGRSVPAVRKGGVRVWARVKGEGVGVGVGEGEGEGEGSVERTAPTKRSNRSRLRVGA